jgi:hypothetical protein
MGQSVPQHGGARQRDWGIAVELPMGPRGRAAHAAGALVGCGRTREQAGFRTFGPMPARNAELGLQRPTTESVGDVRVAGSIKSSPAVNVTPRTCVLEPKQGVSQLLSQPRPCLVSPKRICRPLGAWGSLCSAAFGEGFRPIRRRRRVTGA